MEWITQPEAWIALVTLTILEIVLGIDNIVFISIITGKLPEDQQQKGRMIGLGLAMFGRVVLLLSIAWIMSLTEPLFHAFGRDVSLRDLILIAGGLFLLAKATHEIHHKIEGDGGDPSVKGTVTFRSAIVQILIIDLVFSLDSVITAVGMAEHVQIMILAVVIAVLFMMVMAKPVADFIDEHPTVKMLALSFLLLVGVALIADGFHVHIPRAYIYFAMGFSVFVEYLNLRAQKKARAQPTDVEL